MRICFELVCTFLLSVYSEVMTRKLVCFDGMMIEQLNGVNYLLRKRRVSYVLVLNKVSYVMAIETFWRRFCFLNVKNKWKEDNDIAKTELLSHMQDGLIPFV